MADSSTPAVTTPEATSTPTAAPANQPASTVAPPKSTVIDSKSAKTPTIGTQIYIPFTEIHDDTLILKNGGIRAVLRTTSINFNLKSEEEQNALSYGYQSFLNSLEFPIQIVIRSRKLDVDKYIDSLKVKVKDQTNPLLQKQTYEYIDFVSRLVEYADIMEKDFLVVVPFDPPRAQSTNFMTKMLEMIRGKDTYAEVKSRHNEFDNLHKGLSQRVLTIASGLENLGLKTNQLTTQELIELFYSTYNPVIGRNEKIKDTKEYNLEQ